MVEVSQETVIELIILDENVSKAFRDAIQLPFVPGDFRQLLRRKDEPLPIGWGHPVDLKDYYR